VIYPIKDGEFPDEHNFVAICSKSFTRLELQQFMPRDTIVVFI